LKPEDEIRLGGTREFDEETDRKVELRFLEEFPAIPVMNCELLATTTNAGAT
jgi:hypothetical protein